jgi:hypothetical protein
MVQMQRDTNGKEYILHASLLQEQKGVLLEASELTSE